MPLQLSKTTELAGHGAIGSTAQRIRIVSPNVNAFEYIMDYSCFILPGKLSYVVGSAITARKGSSICHHSVLGCCLSHSSETTPEMRDHPASLLYPTRHFAPPSQVDASLNNPIPSRFHRPPSPCRFTHSTIPLSSSVVRVETQ
jgi:hypothetical protein